MSYDPYSNSSIFDNELIAASSFLAFALGIVFIIVLIVALTTTSTFATWFFSFPIFLIILSYYSLGLLTAIIVRHKVIKRRFNVWFWILFASECPILLTVIIGIIIGVLISKISRIEF